MFSEKVEFVRRRADTQLPPKPEFRRVKESYPKIRIPQRRK